MEKERIIKGITGAAIGALFFCFLSTLLIFIEAGRNGYFIISVAVGIIGGFIIGISQNSDSREKESFFSFNWIKLTWAVLLGFLTFFGTFIFTDLMPESKLVYYIGVAYQWILLEGVILVSRVFYAFFPRSDFSQTLGGSLPWISLLANLLWDYILICLIYWLVAKINNKIKR
jgi:hypothetical protein